MPPPKKQQHASSQPVFTSIDSFKSETESILIYIKKRLKENVFFNFLTKLNNYNVQFHALKLLHIKHKAVEFFFFF